MKNNTRSLILGAAFLMATSAVGPGFLTQTADFTQKLGASFAFVILVSIILDIGAQLNVWRVLAVSGRRAQDVANAVFPGLGYLLAFLVVLGGLAFNIGNIAGAGLGSNVLFGISPETGAVVSAVIAIIVFLLKEATKIMDRFTQIMGFVMILLTLYVMFTSQPPVGEAAVQAVWPDTINALAIITLVGGTVGGYITFAGGHRLIDAGVTGTKNLKQVNQSAVTAIGVASLMRIILFLAALGVIAAGYSLNPENPPASVFHHAAGNIGYKLFGIVMWSAAITSVIGAAYTSVSFIQTFHSNLTKYRNWLIIGFIAFSSATFATVGKPVSLLILAGALNGLILPVSLSVMLVGAKKKSIVGENYHHPLWLSIFGWLIVVVMAGLSILTLTEQIPALINQLG